MKTSTMARISGEAYRKIWKCREPGETMAQALDRMIGVKNDRKQKKNARSKRK